MNDVDPAGAWKGALASNAEAVVDEVYHGVLKHGPDPGGRAHWIRFLRNGGDLRTFIEAAICTPKFVDRVGPHIIPAILRTQDVQSALAPLDTRIAIVGNCQAEPLSRVIQVLTARRQPSSHFVSAEELDDTRRILPRLRQLAATNDVLLLQPAFAAKVLEVAPDLENRVQLFPAISFNAFHPDLCFLYERPGQPAIGVLGGPQQSAIAWYAWRAGMDVRETLAHFCDRVYEALRYHDYWSPASAALLAEGQLAQMPLEGILPQWAGRGCFMHTRNHPKISILVDVGKAILRRLKIPTVPLDPADFLHDSSASWEIWPVYPEIGERLGILGSYLFKPMNRGPFALRGLQLLDLERFVTESFERFARFDAEQVRPDRPFTERYREVFGAGPKTMFAVSEAPIRGSDPVAGAADHPYASLPAERYWSRSVSRRPPGEIDPVAPPRFTMTRETRVATAGSCFAQHIARALVQNGCSYLVSETGPGDATSGERRRRQYGVYSARYGNLYTARQLRQLMQRAYGRFAPAETAWQRPDGRWADPFRPSVEPDGFATIADLDADRECHLAAVRRMFETLEVFVFTLGLTEAWVSKIDAAVFPIAPGVEAGRYDPAIHEFTNFGVDEVVGDLAAFVADLAKVNAKARLLFTVSPVPLAATWSSEHVVTATSYSKSVLRVAAQTIRDRVAACDYFPSYEIITAQHNRGMMYGENLRLVRPAGVEHVMRLFLRHYAPTAGAAPAGGELFEEASRLGDILCEEARLDPGRAALV